MPEIMVSPSCPVCGGDGAKGIELCTECMGTEVLPLRGMNLYLKMSNIGILDKIQEVKTKINQMQADINYIKAKVG